MVKLQLPPEVVLQKDIIYREVNSRALHVDMFTPARKKKQPSPAVLIIHGGGWSSGDKSMQWSTSVKLTEQGYVAVTVEYRLSPEAKYPAAIYDLKAAVRWLRANALKYYEDISGEAIVPSILVCST